MYARAAHLELAIDLGSEPIRGSVSVEAGAPQAFCGWMELTAAIEAVRDRPQPGVEPERGTAKA